MNARWILVAVAMCSAAFAMEQGATSDLLFHASFDKGTADADFAKGDGHSSLKVEADRNFVDGIKGQGLLQRASDRCSYAIAGNFDSSQGTYSVWVKPVNWDGHCGKFRHFLVVPAGPQYTMLLYLYPCGDENISFYLHLNAKMPNDATYRAGAPVDLLKKGQWTHLVCTWDKSEMRMYANGRRVGQGLVSAALPKLDKGEFTVCPVQYWKHPHWSNPDEQTVCDEVRVFGRPLADDEVLDLYALDAPGGVEGLAPKLVAELKPDYFAKTISVAVRAAHLDAAWRERLEKGVRLKLTLRDPKGATIFSHDGALGDGRFTARVPQWVDGDYVAEAKLASGDDALAGRGTLTKPPTPWLPKQTDWRADRVLEPWSPLKLRGAQIAYWNGEVALIAALPAQISANGQTLLTSPIRLVSDQTATWDRPRVVEDKPFRITVEGGGKLGALAASYRTLMEFDGLVRTDITLTPPAAGVEAKSLAFEIPIRSDVARYYRNPVCREWDGQSLDEAAFKPYGWLGNTERGLSWFMESDANWRVGKGKPAVTLRREGDAVVVRLHLISEPTRVAKPLSYTIGFEATPVRPMPKDLYAHYFASGPQIKGSNLFVFGWGKQISSLNGRLIAYDPAKQRKLLERWRAKDQHSLSYTCAQCTANISPEYAFFKDEWNQPYGASFSGYKRVPDDAPYSMVGVCPRSSFADFLVWCVQQHLANDWGDGIYTDIDGAPPCDNATHGCGFTDAFGRSGRTWPLYAHRGLSRRIYSACRDAGKLYFSHAHSNWYSLFNAFNDGWCPGEQYGSKLMGKPHFYMDDIPDRTWRSEFYTPTTGVATFMLPQIGRFGGKAERDKRGPSECCFVAAMCYGVPLWAGGINRQVVEEVWAVQQKFGIGDSEFVPFWRQQEFASQGESVRVSLWRKRGKRLVVVGNFGHEAKQVELRLSEPKPGARFEPAWQAGGLSVANGAAKLTILAKRGALIVVTGMP